VPELLRDRAGPELVDTLSIRLRSDANMRTLLMIGAVLGFLSVAIGAAADHGGWVEGMADSVATAIRYHQLGALMIVLLALVGWQLEPGVLRRGLGVSAALFVTGTVLFSFSIYAAAMTGLRDLTMITPLGGMTLMIAWLAVLLTAFRAR
jgi:uncharacterized membrane protein YgdD (TMEM256/DUF423 family)